VNIENQGQLLMQVLHGLKDKIHQKMQQQLGEQNITGPQAMVMGILKKHGPMPMSAIAKQMGLTNSTVSGIVSRLEKMELVLRKHDDVDRRKVYVSLSENFNHSEFESCFNMHDFFTQMLFKATEEERIAVYEGMLTFAKLLDIKVIEQDKDKDKDKEVNNA
jgi:DNA-binding MarR family transcriptional regulator